GFVQRCRQRLCATPLSSFSVTHSKFFVEGSSELSAQSLGTIPPSAPPAPVAPPAPPSASPPSAPPVPPVFTLQGLLLARMGASRCGCSVKVSRVARVTS